MRGVLYCAVENPVYATYLRASIKSLRNAGYTGPISVVTDLGPVADADVIAPPSYISAKDAKVKAFALSPYDETLYLDCDVYALASIDEIWGHLASSDLCMVLGLIKPIKDVLHATADELAYTIGVCTGYFPHFNSGVVLWSKSSANDALWASWSTEWDRYKDIDELAFARALQLSGRYPLYLPKKFNFIVDTSYERPDGLGVLWHDGFAVKTAPTVYPELFV